MKKHRIITLFISFICSLCLILVTIVVLIIHNIQNNHLSSDFNVTILTSDEYTQDYQKEYVEDSGKENDNFSVISESTRNNESIADEISTEIQSENTIEVNDEETTIDYSILPTYPFQEDDMLTYSKDEICRLDVDPYKDSDAVYIGFKYIADNVDFIGKDGVDYKIQFSHGTHGGSIGFLYNHSEEWFHYLTNTGAHISVEMEKDWLRPWVVTGYTIDDDCICNIDHRDSSLS